MSGYGSEATDPAAKVLKNAGFKPEWIELVRLCALVPSEHRLWRCPRLMHRHSSQGIEIRAEIQQLRDRLEVFPVEELKPTLQAEVDRVNALISKHNRMAPVARVQIGMLSVDRLLAAKQPPAVE